MSVDPIEFRRIMGHWTTGVAVVATVTPDGEPRGLTANAVASVSLDPLLVLACIEHRSDTHRALAAAGVFSINVLGQNDEEIARRFAGDLTGSKFDGVDWHAGPTGAPVLDGALAWVDCRVRDVCDGGDHTVFIGEVLAGGARDEGPLLYYRGGYAGLCR